MKIYTQVLDSTYGKPAVGVHARLSRASHDDNGWRTFADSETDGNGRIEAWESWPLEIGLYRIKFNSDRYFAGLGGIAAYPEVIVVFRVRDEMCIFQVQLTLSAYSYSTYFTGWTGDRIGARLPLSVDPKGR